MLNLFLETATSSEAATTGGLGGYSSLIMIAVIFAAFYFLMIRPQKKRDKEAQAMRNNLEVGDEIVTIGGIVGRVVSVKEDTILIESGSDCTKMRILKGAVQTNNTKTEQLAAQRQEAAKKAAEEREAKKAAKGASKQDKKAK